MEKLKLIVLSKNQIGVCKLQAPSKLNQMLENQTVLFFMANYKI